MKEIVYVIIFIMGLAVMMVISLLVGIEAWGQRSYQVTVTCESTTKLPLASGTANTMELAQSRMKENCFDKSVTEFPNATEPQMLLMIDDCVNRVCDNLIMKGNVR